MINDVEIPQLGNKQYHIKSNQIYLLNLMFISGEVAAFFLK
jgi:hypothetical protein